jgi:PKD repeat protein
LEEKTKIAFAILCVSIMIGVTATAASQSIIGPVVAEAGNPQTVDVNVPVTLSAAGSTTAPSDVTYNWFFRDGQDDTTSQISITHTFTKEGVYNVGLVVSKGGRCALDTVKITVKDSYPNAVAGATSYVLEDEDKAFVSSASSDSNNDIVSYRWDFGDGSSVTQATSAVAHHSYAKQGTYFAALTVTDDSGAKDIETTCVIVSNVAPSANGGQDQTVNENDIVYFNAGSSTDAISDINSLTYLWEFGDGSTGSGISTSHIYAKQGSYVAMVTAIDGDGASDVDSAIITVRNVVPVADAGTSQTVNEGQTVFFDGAETADTPTDRAVLDYSWSFGGQGINPTHIWSDDGTKVTSLTATDDDASSNTDGTNIYVQNVAPSVGINALAVSDSTIVNFTLRSAGEKWRDVHFYLHEDNVLIRELEVYRNPGNPDDQSATAYGVVLESGKAYNASVFFTPDDDPINGQPTGASPAWIILGLEDGRDFWMHHTFNVNHPETYRWDVDFSSIVKVTPRAAAFDPGSDDVTLNWNFGDTQSPIVSHCHANYGKYPMYVNDSAFHIYVWPGTYAVTLTAIDDDNGSSSHTIQLITQPSSVTMDNCAPIATAGDNQVANEDSTVSFSGAAADDPADVLSYSWNFGDNSFATGMNANHVYRYAGTYLVTLTVADNHGAVDQDALFVTVNNIAPASEAGGDQAINEDGTAAFSGSQSIDTASDKPLLTYHWDFGDGTFGNGIGTSHVYTKAGTYTVTLTVTDNDGATDADALTVTVSNVAPTANAGSDQTVNEDETVFFAGTASDTPTDKQTLQYSWTFGDGSIGTGRNPVHSYPSAGEYIVTLTVTDDDGASASSSSTVDVQNVVPMLSQIAYTVDELIVWGLPTQVQYFAPAFDTRSDQAALTYEWAFQKEAGEVLDTHLSGISVFHTYSSSGSYSVSLTVTDDDGAAASMNAIVTVVIDSDGDNLNDEYELGTTGTDPFNYDTDNDKLTDYQEWMNTVPNYWVKTSPKNADSDSDGLNDWEEVFLGEDGYMTNPKDMDTDDDGLSDAEEMFTVAFKSDIRKKIPDCQTDSNNVVTIGSSQMDLMDVSAAPSAKIIKVEARIGITHTYVGDLVLKISNGVTIKTIRNQIGSSNDNIFDSYDLLSTGLFLASDFSTLHDWSLIAEDHAVNNEGFTEYFEIHIVARTNPTAWSSDGSDGLSDKEETTLGQDGWITNPLQADTDGDYVYDSVENSIGTDPTRKDTDRDGINDNVDYDPLHDLMFKITLGVFFALSDAGETLDDDTPDPFVGIHYGGKDFFTTHRDTGTDYVFFGEEYTLDILDNQQYAYFDISVWDDSPTADYKWDINNGSEKVYYASYDILDLDGYKYYFTSGVGDNEYDSEDAYLWFEVTTVRVDRINTILLTPTDGAQSIYTTPIGSLHPNQIRYTGEQKFCLVTLDVTTASTHFVQGYNAIIVPRTVFAKSDFNYTLDRSKITNTVDACLQNLKFGKTDDSKKQTTTGSLICTLHGQVTGTDAEDILFMLYTNSAHNAIAQHHIVTSQLVTLNIADDVIENIPLKGVIFSATGAPPSDLWSSFVQFLVDVGTFIWNGLVAIGNFLVGLATALVEIGMAIVGAIISFLSEVADAVGKIIEVLADIMSWIADMIIGLVQSIFQPIVDALNSLISNFISGVSSALTTAYGEYAATNQVSQATIDAFNAALFGPLYWAIIGIGVIMTIVLTILMPFTFVFSFIFSLASGAIAGLLLAAMNLSTTSNPQPSGVTSSTTPGQSLSQASTIVTSAGVTYPTQIDPAVAWGLFGFFIGFMGLWVSGVAIAQADLTGWSMATIGLALCLESVVLGLAALIAWGITPDNLLDDYLLGILSIIFGVMSLALSLGAMFKPSDVGRIASGIGNVLSLVAIYSGVEAMK